MSYLTSRGVLTASEYFSRSADAATVVSREGVRSREALPLAKTIKLTMAALLAFTTALSRITKAILAR